MLTQTGQLFSGVVLGDMQLYWEYPPLQKTPRKAFWGRLLLKHVILMWPYTIEPSQLLDENLLFPKANFSGMHKAALFKTYPENRRLMKIIKTVWDKTTRNWSYVFSCSASSAKLSASRGVRGPNMLSLQTDGRSVSSLWRSGRNPVCFQLLRL